MQYLFRSLAWVFRWMGLEKLGWNVSHASGIWQTERKSPVLVDYVARLAAGGRIVEFGCGDGRLVESLREDVYSSYLGTDISSLAIHRCQDAHGKTNVAFAVTSMEEWSGEDRTIQLIVCEECLYYLSPQEVTKFLTTCGRSLTETGGVLIVIYSTSKHSGLIDQIKQDWPVGEEKIVGDRLYLFVKPQQAIR